MKNIEALKLVKELKEFCNNKDCNACCFADDIDGHCMLTDSIPTQLDIKEFERQAKTLAE